MARVLVVDDDPDILALVQRQLQTRGHQTLGAANPHEALALLQGRAAPDVAVLDVTMPRMTGIQAAREIKAHAPGTTVLLLSMYDDERYFFDGLKAGASGYVLKSSTAQELLLAIRTVYQSNTYLSASLTEGLGSILCGALVVVLRQDQNPNLEQPAATVRNM